MAVVVLREVEDEAGEVVLFFCEVILLTVSHATSLSHRGFHITSQKAFHNVGRTAFKGLVEDLVFVMAAILSRINSGVIPRSNRACVLRVG